MYYRYEEKRMRFASKIVSLDGDVHLQKCWVGSASPEIIWKLNEDSEQAERLLQGGTKAPLKFVQRDRCSMSEV